MAGGNHKSVTFMAGGNHKSVTFMAGGIMAGEP